MGIPGSDAASILISVTSLKSTPAIHATPDFVILVRDEPLFVIPFTFVADDKSSVVFLPVLFTRVMLLMLNKGVVSLTLPISSTVEFGLIFLTAFVMPSIGVVFFVGSPE